jgi:hypothetical protein
LFVLGTEAHVAANKLMDKDLVVDILVGLAAAIMVLRLRSIARSGVMRARGWTITRRRQPDLFRRNVVLEAVAAAFVVFYFIWRVVHRLMGW